MTEGGKVGSGAGSRQSTPLRGSAPYWTVPYGRTDPHLGQTEERWHMTRWLEWESQQEGCSAADGRS